MARSKSVSVITIVIAAVATPATLALSWAMLTGDQRFRPLGLTDDGLGIFWGGPEELQVEVTLYWDPNPRERDDALELGRAIKKTFDAKGISSVVYVQATPAASSSYVTYRVGKNEIGPYSIAEATMGVDPAVEAYRAFLRTYPDRFETTF